MSWPTIDVVRKWTNQQKTLPQGLLGLAVESVAGCVPGGSLAVWSTRILGEFAKQGVERLSGQTMCRVTGPLHTAIGPRGVPNWGHSDDDPSTQTRVRP
jgi:hypothetical protein